MIASFIQRAVVQGIPLLFGSTGEIITEKSGNLNLGIPGIMYVGGISGVIGAFMYEQSVADPSAMNPFLAVVIPLFDLYARFPLHGTDLFPSDSNPSGQSECDGSCADDLWYRLRQLFWRFIDQTRKK